VPTRGHDDGLGGKDVLEFGVSVADGYAGAEDVKLMDHVVGRKVLADRLAQSGERGRGDGCLSGQTGEWESEKNRPKRLGKMMGAE
jgi:hypothetical protein